MHVSLNWLKRHIDFDLTNDELSEILTAIGLEVEGMADFESVKGGLAGVVCGVVKTCDKHPDADRLKVTTVDVGGPELLNIVCGAPNVAAGQHVWVATEGTTLYTEEGEAFKIKKSKIRGQESCGMICAEDELGLGQSHDGIMVLPESVVAGSQASDYYEVSTDTVYEIGLTPNRSDATHHRGVAEDLAAYLKVNGYQYTLKAQAELTQVFDQSTDEPITITVENPERCPRYAGVCIEGLQIQESPSWMKNLLLSIGVRPISNVVDITNFVLHDVGQPMHAFDLDKIEDNAIRVKTLPAGSKFLSLDEVERSLLATDLMICDGGDKPMCIGGVFGGADSGVTETTSRIFLESAHFNAGSVRVSSTKHNLRTDAAKVFEKGSDPAIVTTALSYATSLLVDLAGATVSSKLYDVQSEAIKPLELIVRVSKTEEVIGTPMGSDKIVEILDALSMQPQVNGDDIRVTIPTNKADVLREIDVIEEILRIYGFNQVNTEDSLQIPLIPTDYPSISHLRETIANTLVGAGFNEMMGLSLIESKYTAERDQDSLVHINNTSNIHLDVMRPSMLVSGLVSVAHNLNYQNLSLRLFEMGKTYSNSNDYEEFEKVTLFLTGNTASEHWSTDLKGVNYYDIKSIADHVMQAVGLNNAQVNPITESIELDYGVEYRRGPMQIARLGKVKDELLKSMSIKQEVYFAEFDMATVYKLYKGSQVTFSNISKFPTTKRDLALVIDQAVNYAQVESIIRKEAKAILKDVSLFDIYTNEEQLGLGKKSYAIKMTFGLDENTLTDKEIDAVMNKMIKAFESKIGASIRK